MYQVEATVWQHDVTISDLDDDTLMEHCGSKVLFRGGKCRGQNTYFITVYNELYLWACLPVHCCYLVDNCGLDCLVSQLVCIG